jgi:hypothetical protein
MAIKKLEDFTNEVLIAEIERLMKDLKLKRLNEMPRT